MGKYKYLLKNMGLLTISNFATKLLSFFLVPLYTTVLSTAQYGTYDLYNTTISLLIPILTFDIQEATLRFSIDNNSDKKSIFSISLTYSALSSVFVIGFVVINNIFHILPLFEKFYLQFILLYIFNTMAGMISYFARGISKIFDLSVSSVISSAVMIGCNILFLLVFKWGINGYFLASIMGSAAQCFYLSIRINLFRYITHVDFHSSIHNEMVRYSKPMIANAVSWWVNNASDRYVVTSLVGVAANGIYSVGYKIPSIISVLQSIFGQAWTLSAVKDFDREDKSCFFINIYNLYNFMLVFACTGLMLIDKPLARLLYAKDFYSGWVYAPFLMISTIFSGLSAFIGGLLSAMKKSTSFAKTSVITAVVNTIGNILLVIVIGPLGAAVSTAIAYALMWILRLRDIKKDINLRVNFKRDLTSYLVLDVQALMLCYINRNKLINISQLGFVIAILMLYIPEIRRIMQRLRKAFIK